MRERAFCKSRIGIIIILAVSVFFVNINAELARKNVSRPGRSIYNENDNNIQTIQKNMDIVKSKINLIENINIGCGCISAFGLFMIIGIQMIFQHNPGIILLPIISSLPILLLLNNNVNNIINNLFTTDKELELIKKSKYKQSLNKVSKIKNFLLGSTVAYLVSLIISAVFVLLIIFFGTLSDDSSLYEYE